LKPTLLVVELWGLGDLVIATPFLNAASERFEVTLLAKPHAGELRARFWPGVKLVPFIAPWTAFQHKYRLFTWPWRELFRLRKLRGERFELGVSAREDPRDHVLLRSLCVGKRLGFPRLGSQLLLTDSLIRPGLQAHRYEYWRALGRTLDLELPARDRIPIAPRKSCGEVLIHTGAGQKVRVWPLDRYRNLVARLRRQNYRVRVVCDRDQADWWRSAGETQPFVPQTLSELIALMETTGVFVGNDSGPGHLAALSGVPTFTLFGPQLPESFSPLHPAAEWLEGKPCPYKPCWDSCRFPTPHCLWELEEETVGSRVDQFVAKHIQNP
jgi:heptosyltransferase-2